MSLKMSGLMSVMVYVFFVIQFAMLAWIVWGCDCQYANTLSSRANFMTLGVVTFFSLPYLLLGKRRLFATGIAGFAIGMLVLSLVDQTAEKAMNRLADRIQPGMTRAQVETLAADYFPVDGRFGPTVWQTSKGEAPLFPPSVAVLSNKSVVMEVTYTLDGLVQSTYVSD